MKQHRIARVSEAIREVAAQVILFELKDPRIKNVTVTRAEVSADMQKAKVFVSVMGTQKDQDLCMHGLKHSAGYLQSKLADRLQTRFTPTVTFIRDDGVKKSIEITKIINDALAQSRPEVQQNADGPADEVSEEG
ncbi:MAG TPA: 30S ribosome-binding factor RbfA [Gemmataceae bacterium]|nr:30S ribosome-binding factor RbfA [Gemmataceae bacterium]